MTPPPRIAIVGAGLTGLIAARTLRAHGIETELFEKSRAPGGRAATRYHGDYRFDHGAQYFTQRDLRTAALLDELRDAGVVAAWPARIVAYEQGTWRSVSSKEARWVGVPGMRALGEHLAVPEQVRYDTRVQALEQTGSAWQLRSDSDQVLGTFDQVLVCIPAAQACELLLPHAPSFASALSSSEMRPCIAAMLLFESEPAVHWDAAFVNDNPLLAWMARNASKPGRAAHPAWVLHATASWSEMQLEAPPASLLHPMLDALWELLGARTPLVYSAVHRWRYAVPAPESPNGAENAVRTQSLHDAGLGLGAGGDWCAGGRVEGALLSGMSLARRLL